MINPFPPAKKLYKDYKDNQEGKHGIFLPDWDELDAKEQLKWIEMALDEHYD